MTRSVNLASTSPEFCSAMLMMRLIVVGFGLLGESSSAPRRAHPRMRSDPIFEQDMQHSDICSDTDCSFAGCSADYISATTYIGGGSPGCPANDSVTRTIEYATGCSSYAHDGTSNSVRCVNSTYAIFKKFGNANCRGIPTAIYPRSLGCTSVPSDDGDFSLFTSGAGLNKYVNVACVRSRASYVLPPDTLALAVFVPQATCPTTLLGPGGDLLYIKTYEARKCFTFPGTVGGSEYYNCSSSTNRFWYYQYLSSE